MSKEVSKQKECNIAHNENKPHCPHCSSENVYGISRVVGYFSVIDNWNNSKKAEFKKRQKGNYWPTKLIRK